MFVALYHTIISLNGGRFLPNLMGVAGYNICIVEKHHGDKSKVMVKVTEIVNNIIVNNSAMTHRRNIKLMSNFFFQLHDDVLTS